jgi:predicted RNase H-like HicB family nuclease
MRGILSDAGLTIEDAQISPELRGCVTDGNTIDEALRNFKEAASLLLENRQEENPLEGLDRPGRIYAEIEVEA